ncbi:MAG: hypothetical protein CEO22_141 [Candidatus Berkelbacteria bacterium Gr01-1014_85]|uniref:RNA polymerase alpha subunit C-terminal domain-containing protein n=1 Tax=Candidatus Berkelbacteria bacterium Gr01-1014_85 TaxID=2017150 RepID=A0A554JDD7_9BACT|nr:MAG: hypothetical protein CEO22_141 [Candidatus Berkelbacteria bacterium Gr01-1014_85]
MSSQNPEELLRELHAMVLGLTQVIELDQLRRAVLSLVLGAEEEMLNQVKQLFLARQATKFDEAMMDRPITACGFSTRVNNCLTKGRILTVRDLVGSDATSLLLLRHFGRHCLIEVVDKLAEYGLTIKGWSGDCDKVYRR